MKKFISAEEAIALLPMGERGEKKKKFISVEEAIALLPTGETVHTFYNLPDGLICADWDRKDIIETLKKAGNIIELTGNAARSLDHGMCVYAKGCNIQSDVLFIKTDPEKLKKIDPQ